MSRVRRFNEGDTVDDWTIVSYPYKSRKILLRCKCGVEVWRFPSNLNNGSARCKDCSYIKISSDKTDNHSLDWKKRKIFYLTLSHSNKEKTVTMDEVWFLSQQKCHYCEQTPSNIFKYRGGELKYNGLDRINSSLGYHLDNIRTACWKCNSAKKDMSDQEFAQWLEDIYAHWPRSTS